MTGLRAQDIATYLDDVLKVATIPDYPQALNGLQIENAGPIERLGAAVDFSARTVDGAARAGINFLLVHHGAFWGGLRRLVGPAYRRFCSVFRNDLAVYAAHLPLDAHQRFGNNVLLAEELQLLPSAGFARYENFPIGVSGESELSTAELFQRLEAFARKWGGVAKASAFEPSRRTHRWAICTGAGASADTLREAASAGIDTLVVGEGPHYSAVDAPELGIAVLYGGHYATEILGVRAVTAHLAERFSIPWEFIHAPTGM